MKIPLFNGLCSGGGAKSSASGGICVAGSIVLLLVGSLVGDCGGKPFHTGGQAEVEEDTTQGSLKEKFPAAGALVLGSALDSSDMDEDNESDSSVIGLVDLGHWGNGKPSSHQHGGSFGTVVQKRSLTGGGRAFDDGGGDEFMRYQRYDPHNRPMYFDQSNLPVIGEDGAAAAAAPPGNNIRQKLMGLRNQYGDKWFAFASPYAYRKRQILYRQCFFNPISCF